MVTLERIRECIAIAAGAIGSKAEQQEGDRTPATSAPVLEARYDPEYPRSHSNADRRRRRYRNLAPYEVVQISISDPPLLPPSVALPTSPAKRQTF